MTAARTHDGEPVDRHPLAAGASPAVIRAALLVEDRAGFDSDYNQALSDARDTFDLSSLHRMLERWRRLAVLQSDPQAYRETIRRAALIITGNESPPDEPIATTRDRAGL